MSSTTSDNTRRRRLFALVFAFALLMIPATASAATVIGDPLTENPTWDNDGSSITQITLASGAAYNGSSVAGVLTSMRVRTSGGGGTLTLRVLRKTGTSGSDVNFLNIGPSVDVAVTPDATAAGHVTSVNVRQPIAVGDRLSVYNPVNGLAVHYNLGAPGNCAYTGATHLPGTTVAYQTAGCNNFIPLVQGTVEPDADGDGFGDETQDLCPSDATTQGTCPVTVVPVVPATADLAVSVVRAGRSRLGRSAAKSFKITNTGPDTATNVKLSLTRNSKLKSSVIVSKGMCVVAADRRSCTIPTLAAGQSVTVRVRALARRTARSSIKATVASDTSDPVLTNNVATATVRFKLK